MQGLHILSHGCAAAVSFSFTVYLLLQRCCNSFHSHVLSAVCRELKEILGFKNYQTCMREAALLDYNVCGFWWAKEASFTPAQTSFTMAVLHMLLENIRGEEDRQVYTVCVNSLYAVLCL